MVKTSKRIIISISALFFVVILFFIITFYSIKNTRFSFKVDDFIYVPIGATLDDVLNSLETKFDLDISYKVKVYTKFNALDSSIKPGEHALKDVVSIPSLLAELTQSLSNDIVIQIIEGERVFDIAGQLASNKDLKQFDSLKFVNLCKDKDFISSLAGNLGFYEVDNLEGFLFPDTYRVNPSYNESDLIKIFIGNFLDKIKPYAHSIKSESIDTIMIIASIIEAETEVDSEMPIISSVYYNRIKINMPLQADPTISYSTDKPMRPSDKDSEDPYNTYTRKLQLPPTPINSPGLAAIKASIYPDETDYLYMFSSKDKMTHQFSKTYEEHKRTYQ